MLFPVMEQRNKCPKHGTKAALCSQCSLCKNCPGATDDCVLDHRQHIDGPAVLRKLKAEAAKRLAEERKEAKDDEEAATGLGKRSRPLDLSEEALESEVVRKVHKRLELEDATRVAPRSISDFVEAIGIESCTRLLELTNPAFVTMAWLGIDYKVDLALSMVKKAAKMACHVLSGGVQLVGDALFAQFQDRMRSQTPDKPHCQTLAKTFLTCGEKLTRRVLFAHLMAEIPDTKKLTQLLVNAKNELFQNPHLLGQMNGSSGGLDGSDDSDESDESDESDYDVEDASQDSTMHDDDSPVAALMKRRLERLCRWPVSRVRREQAQLDIDHMCNGKPLSRKHARSRVPLPSVQCALRFIEDVCALSWAGGATKTVDIGCCTLQNMPYMNTALDARKAWSLYCTTAMQNGDQVFGEKRVGRPTFTTLFQALTRQISKKTSLSYLLTDALEASELLGDMLKTVESFEHKHLKEVHDREYWDTPLIPVQAVDLHKLRQEHLQHLKYKLRPHIIAKPEYCDGDASHCAAHAVGAQCSKQHEIRCSHCLLHVGLPTLFKVYCNAVANDIKRVAEKLPSNSPVKTTLNDDANELRTMLDVVPYLARTFYLFQQHTMRGQWQGLQIKEVMASLTQTKVAIIIDHKQKVLPQSYQESSVDHYGKTGMSLCGAAVKYVLEEGGPMQTRFYDIVCLDNRQDAEQVQSILQALTSVIKRDFPLVETLFLVSDNETAFSSGDNMKYIWSQNNRNWGLKEGRLSISRWYFFEAQCGKTVLDTHFSFVGIMLSRFTRSVKAIAQPQDIFDALAYDGGIANMSALLLEIQRRPQGTNEGFKLQGVQSIHEVQFSNLGIRTFQQTGAIDFAEYKMQGDVPQRAYRIVKDFTSPVFRVAQSSSVTSENKALKRVIRGEVSPTMMRLEEALVLFAQGANQPIIDISPYANQDALRSFEFGFDASETATPNPAKRSKSHNARTGLQNFIADYGFHWAEPLVRKRPAVPQECEALIKGMVSLHRNVIMLY